jgi:hypothetical protein
MVFLCFCFGICASYSQKRNSITSLQVGDKVQNLLLSRALFNSSNNIANSKISGKSILVCFWAPWQTSSIGAFDKLDSIQGKFKNNLQIVFVTKFQEQFSEKVLLSQNLPHNNDLISVVGDTTLSALFKHKITPHYVWIDSSRTVKAITGLEAITEDNIHRFLSSRDFNLPLKHDTVKLNFDHPTFVEDHVQNRDGIIHHSILTKFVQQFPSAALQGKGWVTCTNHSILMLYQIALGKFDLTYLNNNRLVLEGFSKTEDSLEIGRFSSVLKNHWNEIKYNYLYNYELVVDSNYTKEQRFDLMHQDLNQLFAAKGISGRLENRKVKSHKLTLVEGEDKIKTKNGAFKVSRNKNYLLANNVTMSQFIDLLNGFFRQSEGSLSIVDGSGYSKNIDVEINGELTEFESLNKELLKYGLKLVETELEMPMVVITKKVDVYTQK